MNDAPVLIAIAIAFLIALIILWMVSRRRRESALDTLRARARTASEPKSDSDTFAHVRTLMTRGDTIAAIKVLIEKTGMGVAEATATVERLETGGYADNAAGLSSARLPGELDAAVRDLLQRGDKIAAIDLVRERLNLDLRDAKELVDKFE